MYKSAVPAGRSSGCDTQARFRDALARAGMGPSTIRRRIGVIRSALAWSHERGEIPRLPLVKVPVEQTGDGARVATVDELRALFAAAAHDHQRRYLLLALATCGRPKAILDLTWDRIDAQSGTADLHVPGTRRTKKARPVVPVAAVARSYLEAHRGLGQVCQWHSRPLGSAKTMLRKLAKDAGVYQSRAIAQELKALIEHARPHGVVLDAPLSNMPRIVRAISSTGTPLVRLSPGTVNGDPPSVCTNDREISAQMTRYLASLGHRRIAFIKGHVQHKAVGNRYLGYLDGLRDSGLDLDEALVGQGDNSFGSGGAAGRRLLELRGPPTSIFAANDVMAAGVIRAAALLGVAIPGRLSVAGCDDIALASQLCPTLTTIRQPLEAMAERAALALMRDPHKPMPARGADVVPATMCIRESTGPAPLTASRA